jgi:hypothetical protein
MTETVPVAFELLEVQPVHGVRDLLALASVSLDVAGVPIELHGLRVVPQPGGRLGVGVPMYRHAGVSRPAAVLPPELLDAIAVEVAAELGSRTRHPAA